jgi:hypothetical protein
LYIYISILKYKWLLMDKYYKSYGEGFLFLINFVYLYSSVALNS